MQKNAKHNAPAQNATQLRKRGAVAKVKTANYALAKGKSAIYGLNL